MNWIQYFTGISGKGLWEIAVDSRMRVTFGHVYNWTRAAGQYQNIPEEKELVLMTRRDMNTGRQKRHITHQDIHTHT